MTIILDNTHSTTSAPLKCRTVTSDAAHAALATWRELELRIGEQSLASGATWTDCWLSVFGNVVPYRFLIAEAGGVVRGICLMTDGAGQKIGPCAVRTQHLGTAGEPQPGSVCVEYNRILVEPAYAEQFIGLIAETLKRDRRWEQLRLDGFSEKELEPWKQHFPGAEIRRRDSRYFDFKPARETGAEVIDSLGRSTRSNIRRRLKQYGELNCEWAETVEQAEDILRELIDLHQARWQAVGEPGAFASDRFKQFQTTASLRLFMEKKVVLFRVQHQSETVGCLLLLVDRNRLLDYLSGFAGFDEKPSPGLITHYLCMLEAMKRGYDAYDFLVGDKQHKSNLSNSVAQLCWLNWSRPSWKIKAIETLRTLKRRFK